MSACEKCELNPCACRWIVQLGRGAQWEWRRAEALAMWDEPLPEIEGRQTYHYSTCPCPPCWSIAQSTYANYPNVIPLPLAPDKPLAANDTQESNPTQQHPQNHPQHTHNEVNNARNQTFVDLTACAREVSGDGMDR